MQKEMQFSGLVVKKTRLANSSIIIDLLVNRSLLTESVQSNINSCMHSSSLHRRRRRSAALVFFRSHGLLSFFHSSCRLFPSIHFSVPHIRYHFSFPILLLISRPQHCFSPLLSPDPSLSLPRPQFCSSFPQLPKSLLDGLETPIC